MSDYKDLLSPLDRAEDDLHDAECVFHSLQNFLMKTPEYRAVQEARETMNQLENKVRQLKRVVKKPEVEATILSLKEEGYECRTGHTGIYDYVICKSDMDEIAHLNSTHEGIEGITRDFKYVDMYELIGFGDTEEEAWENAVSTKNWKKELYSKF